jgi:hypothetical protein
MSLVVVRCPSCRGAARVSADAIGHMVGCPRCHTPFVAEEEIPVVPVARLGATKAPAARPAAAVPVAPPRRREAPPPEEPDSDVAPAEPVAFEIPDPEHDPHRPPIAGLPVSVLVGLALLPFGIPLLWLVAPLVTGQAAALSLAVPVSLATAAAALCLGVVYTIDWTATTRIKGVLMLVGLSYLSAAGLYFLKKDMMDRVQAWGADPTNRWTKVSVNTKEHHFEFKLRGHVWAGDAKPLLPSVTTEGNKLASYKSETDAEYRYSVAWGKTNDERFKPDDAWFDRVRDQLAQNAPGAAIKELAPPGEPGQEQSARRQWALTFADGTVRVVRVYAVRSRVYYLSAEGPRLEPDDEDLVTPFFTSFQVHK